MEPPPRSLALDAHYCIMVRVAWPTEYKYASAIGCACWRAPLGIDSVPNTTCDGRPNAEPMASAFPGSRRGHGRPSNKQRGQTTRTSALTEITPYKCLEPSDGHPDDRWRAAPVLVWLHSRKRTARRAWDRPGFVQDPGASHCPL